MGSFSRRDFVKNAALGVTGGAGGLLLSGNATATEANGDLGAYGEFVGVRAQGQAQVQQPANWRATEDNILGPYHRRGAPFRAKITPPLVPGNVLLIRGRVWGLDTRRPLANTVIDIWQADSRGRYDNDDPNNPPARDVFTNRARLMTDENGYYEYETIHPGAYQIAANQWRPPHIHYWVRRTGYRELITQLYFRGDMHQRTDRWIRPSLTIALTQQRAANNQTYKLGVFDIILQPQAGG